MENQNIRIFSAYSIAAAKALDNAKYNGLYAQNTKVIVEEVTINQFEEFEIRLINCTLLITTHCVKTFHIYDNTVDVAKEYPSHYLVSVSEYFVSGIKLAVNI